MADSDDNYDEDFDFDFGDDNDEEDEEVPTHEEPHHHDDPLNQKTYEKLDPKTKVLASEATKKSPKSKSSPYNVRTPSPRSPRSPRSTGSRKTKKPPTKAAPTSNNSSTIEQQEAHIAKLELANDTLRNQLKEFSRALDASLKAQSAATSAGAGIHAIRAIDQDGKSTLRSLLNGKEKSLNHVKRKLEQSRKANESLKHELANAYSSDRLVQLTNEKLALEKELQRLTAENRSLSNVQRTQAKAIERQDANKKLLPGKVTALQEELRVLKERLRKIKEKAKNDQSTYNKQHEQMVDVIEKNKALVREVKRLESGRPAKAKDSGAGSAWEKEKKKLSHKIALLEKTARQEKLKANTEVRKHKEEADKAKRRVAKMKDVLEAKEKEMRTQVLEVKKMKRAMRDIAMGKQPLPDGPAPWEQDATSPSQPLGSPGVTEHGFLANSEVVAVSSPTADASIQQTIAPSSQAMQQPTTHQVPHQQTTATHQVPQQQSSAQSSQNYAESQTPKPSQELPLQAEEKLAVEEQDVRSGTTSSPVDAEVVKHTEQPVQALDLTKTQYGETESKHMESKPTPPRGSAGSQRGPRVRAVEQQVSDDNLETKSADAGEENVVESKSTEESKVVDKVAKQPSAGIKSEETSPRTSARSGNSSGSGSRVSKPKSAFAKPMMKKKKKKQVF